MLGAYLVLLPHAKVLTLIFFVLREVPAVLFLGVWFGFQLLDGSPSLRTPKPAAASRSSRTSGASSSASDRQVFQQRQPLSPTY